MVLSSNPRGRASQACPLARTFASGVFGRVIAQWARRIADVKRALGVGKRPRLERAEPKPRPPGAALAGARGAAVDPVVFHRALARLGPPARCRLASHDIGRRGRASHTSPLARDLAFWRLPPRDRPMHPPRPADIQRALAAARARGRDAPNRNRNQRPRLPA